MTPTSKTIIFFGTDDFSAASLRALIAAQFTIGAVVTKPDSKKGRGRAVLPPIVKTIAEAHGIPVWQPLRVSDIADDIRAVTTHTGHAPLGVLVSYGKIIPQAIIDLFTPGIVNVHPSLLPRYRGPSPVESAIIHGDSETGVTLMQLSAAMDAGPIYTQQTIPLTGDETTPTLEAHLAERGAHALCTHLPAIIDGRLTPTPQNDDVATYCQLLSKNDAALDPATLTADAAERRIRAYIAFPKTKLTIAGQPIIVTKAHVVTDTTPANALTITCADNTHLALDELIGPSGRAMSAQSFANGYLK